MEQRSLLWDARERAKDICDKKKLLNRRKGAEPEITEEIGFGGWFSLEDQRERTLRMWDNEIPVGVEQAECRVHEVTGAV